MVGSPTTNPTTTRPEIQALRAVAIGCVVAYHFWPAILPAGFIGVDVFFVVSGFLITGLLVRDAERWGRVRLKEFYVRRVRRILPAALVVLSLCAVATLLFVPLAEWRAFLQQILSSGLYVQNWHLARDSQIPARADLESTPVQHFWSLSVEEQFYLVWPLLIILGLSLAARSGRRRLEVVAAILAVTTLASFVHGTLLTMQDHNLAYFSTLARAWEFGVGGLLALAPQVTGERLRRTRAVAGWAGLAAIAVAALAFKAEADAFPGTIALLPVLGTAAVIWSGMPRAALSLAPAAALRPVQWLGGISYSLYLWHWPIIMFTPYITGRPSEAPVMVLLLALSIVVADASKRWIEDPFRAPGAMAAQRARAGRAGRIVAASGTAVAAIVLLTSGVTGYAVQQPRTQLCHHASVGE
jgi:peptidoglycan/LPS O-acetylase OafA/YrhL